MPDACSARVVDADRVAVNAVFHLTTWIAWGRQLALAITLGTLMAAAAIGFPLL